MAPATPLRAPRRRGGGGGAGAGAGGGSAKRPFQAPALLGEEGVAVDPAAKALLADISTRLAPAVEAHWRRACGGLSR